MGKRKASDDDFRLLNLYGNKALKRAELSELEAAAEAAAEAAKAADEAAKAAARELKEIEENIKAAKAADEELKEIEVKIEEAAAAEADSIDCLEVESTNPSPSPAMAPTDTAAPTIAPTVEELNLEIPVPTLGDISDRVFDIFVVE